MFPSFSKIPNQIVFSKILVINPIKGSISAQSNGQLKKNGDTQVEEHMPLSYTGRDQMAKTFLKQNITRTHK